MTPETFRDDFADAVSDENLAAEEAAPADPIGARLDEAERILAHATERLNAYGDGPVPPEVATEALLSFGIAQCHQAAVMTVANLSIADSLQRVVRALEKRK